MNDLAVIVAVASSYAASLTMALACHSDRDAFIDRYMADVKGFRLLA